MATPGSSAIMADFFDFGEATMPEVSQEQTGNNIASDQNVEHIESEAPSRPASQEFNTNFSDWLPRYQKPEVPCEYCRSRSLECFIYNSNGAGKKGGCSPCNALFRPCSFSNPEKLPAQRQKTALDTLDIVDETGERCFGGLTGRKPMRSLGHLGPMDEDQNDDSQGPKKGAAAARFPRAASKILKEWMIAHIDNPYPTEEEKEQLKSQTGLSIGQISTWMANTRRRQKARPKRSASPSLRPSTDPMDIPAGKTWDTMGPFERWKHSPPENEPAPLTAIAQAVETFDPPEHTNLSSSYRKENSNGSTGSFSVFKAPSVSSLETGFTNMSSGSLNSHNSAYSHGSRRSLGSMNSLKAKERRRRRRVPTRAPKADTDEGPRMFQCTFCTDRFKSKYDWSRHEKSLHLSLEKWLCAPIGEVIADKLTGKPKCVYCDEIEPSKEHLATHNHNACYEKGTESRTFYRKDHLRQHLRLMHGCKMTASMESWKSEAQYIKSKCGFCQMTFTTWQDRIDHLAKEFRNGADMKDWKGCRGLEPHVAVHVTNAMPPYLIAMEGKSPFPYSATNKASLKQTYMTLDVLGEMNLGESPAQQQATKTLSFGALHQVSSDPSATGRELHPDATCWEILTLRLGKLAREHIAQHGPGSITDEMLQAEARRILYGDPDDTWNQTAADNPEWLNLFKKAHGIDINAPISGLVTPQVIHDHLGIRSTSLVDPSFDASIFTCSDMDVQDPMRFAAYECSLAGTNRYAGRSRQPSSGRQSPNSVPGLTGSVSASPSSQVAPVAIQTAGIYEPIDEMACTSPGGPCYGENGEIGYAVRNNAQAKKTYWLDSMGCDMQQFDTIAAQQCTKSGDALFPTITEQSCTLAGDALLMPTLTEQACSKTGAALSPDLEFPSWDQLPCEFQNPTTSADFNSTIVSSATTGVSVSGVDGTLEGAGPFAWDDQEMNFAMDLDLDLDMELNMLGKC